MRTQGKLSRLQPGRRKASPVPDHAGILDFLLSEQWENKCRLFISHPVCESRYSSPNRLRHLTLRSTCLFHAQFLDFYDENNGKEKRSGEKGKALVDRLYWSTWWRWVREKTFHNLEDIGKGILWGGEEFSEVRGFIDLWDMRLEKTLWEVLLRAGVGYPNTFQQVKFGTPSLSFLLFVFIGKWLLSETGPDGKGYIMVTKIQLFECLTWSCNCYIYWSSFCLKTILWGR